jgi:hypothetical protein
MYKKLILIVVLATLLLPTASLRAETVYQNPKEFIKEAFDGDAPSPQFIRLLGERRRRAGKILGHAPNVLRTRYWRRGTRSAWILEEIGKTKPITAGFIVENGLLADARILVYRESHGSEVRHSFFTKQFKGASIDADAKLSRSIDGISGATLSVSAIRRLATLALYLDRETRQL